jgi:hypothetical protein
VCGQYDETNGEWETFAGTDQGNLGDSHSRATRSSCASGDDVNFYARAFGSMTWLLIDSTSFPAQADPLEPSFGASGLSKGTAVGFDGLLPRPARRRWRRPAPSRWRRTSTPHSPRAAGADLADAEDALGAATTGVDALPESKENKSAKAGKSLAMNPQPLPGPPL